MDFNFRFKDLQNKFISYYATYTESGDLEISVRKLIDLEDHLGDKSESKKLRKISGEQAWQMFHEHCSFEEILREIKYEADIPEETNLEFQLEETRKVSKFLKQVSECPFMLGAPEYASVLIDILEAAKWGTDNVRKSLKAALIDNLIPQHPGGKKPQIQNLSSGKKLLRALGESLFQKLKDKLVKQNRWVSKTDFIENWDDETFKWVTGWSALNEKRLCRLKEQELKWLIKSPTSYADHLICSKFEIAKSTLERGK